MIKFDAPYVVAWFNWDNSFGLFDFKNRRSAEKYLAELRKRDSVCSASLTISFDKSPKENVIYSDIELDPNPPRSKFDLSHKMNNVDIGEIWSIE